MKLSPIIATALSLGRALAGCNADNCARAAVGTFRGLQAARASDCSSFQLCAVTKPTLTLTEVNIVETTQTQTVTVPFPTTPVRRQNEKRTIPVQSCTLYTTSCPTQVPTYASACQGADRYASACSCAGFTKQYTTPPHQDFILHYTFTQRVYDLVYVFTDATTASTTTYEFYDRVPFLPLDPLSC